jgi:hypothetical protein
MLTAGCCEQAISASAPLPYVSDLANLVVIESFDALAASGLTNEEVQRITQPGGVMCSKKDGR